MCWSYALINNRIGEIYFDRKDSKVIIQGHCYLGGNERVSVSEAHTIQEDIPNNQFSYYRDSYRHKI